MRFEDRNMEAVAAAVIDIASISSSKAGKWLSADAVAEMTGRTEVEIQQLKDYIESQQGRLVQVSPTRQVLLGAVEQQWQQDCN
jgi:transcription initiation factor TFIIIB Brf1 subunit/transcription initiation factor TFIIB